MPSYIMNTITQARKRWLDGDASAWARYVECCLRLEAEHRANRAEDDAPVRPDHTDRKTISERVRQ